jgi:hypothetical protein
MEHPPPHEIAIAGRFGGMLLGAGAGALAHAAIGAIAGLRLSGVLTFVVVGVGFLGFGFFAQFVAPA